VKGGWGVGTEWDDNNNNNNNPGGRGHGSLQAGRTPASKQLRGRKKGERMILSLDGLTSYLCRQCASW
jgi:hypothetical protein